jgi:predicted ATP-grasp superfamily ATP-dependent carboligase
MKINVNGLGVVRSLGRQGIRVVGVDYRKESDGLFNSKYCDKIVMVADPVKEPEVVVQALLGIADELGVKPFLIPAADLFVEFVSEYRERLADRFIFTVPEKETIRMISSKKLQYQFAQEHDVPIAKTYYPTSLEEVRSIAKESTYPIYIKPFSSALWSRDFPAKGLRAKSPDELVHGYEKAAAKGQEVIIQEIIPGPATNLFTTSGYFRKGGEPVATFQHRKIRQYPVDFGMGTLTETCKDETAWRQSLDFVRLVGFQGICEVELKKDVRDGIYKLIEINPRTWTQISQTSCAGINLPYLEYCDLVGLPLPKMAEFKTGIRWWDAMNDYRAFIDLKQRGKLTWSQWLKSVVGVECNGYFAWDDLRPVLQRTGFGLGAVKMVYDLQKLGVSDVFRV